MTTTSQLEASRGMISLETYLQDTISAIDPSFRMKITEKHRKNMMRGLMGLKKVNFDEQLRQTRVKSQWEKTKSFVENQLTSLDAENLSGALRFQEGIDTMDSFETAPLKLFSFMARGRTYQGKFERLLSDVKDELLPAYLETVEEPSEVSSLRYFVDEKVEEGERKQQLIQCIEKSFAKASSNPLDGGVASGKKGELDLETYLSKRILPGTRIICNIFVKPGGKQLKNGKGMAIEVSSPELPDGMTSEFDAMVIHQVDGRVRILELWEAKATLHPITIRDALSKKYAAVKYILADKDARLCIDGERLPIESLQPRIGIFGSKIFKPIAAGRRAQVALCENSLESDPKAVLEALEIGSVQAPDVKPLLQETLELSRRLQPSVVVSSLLDAATDEDELE
jgi:hypothetical protein